MKTTLTFQSPGKSQLANLKAQLAIEAASLEREIKLTITNSTPRGRTYRTGRISSASKRLAGLGLKSFKTKSGQKRFMTGANFHRASAKGQAPAIRTGALLNANRAVKVTDSRWKVINSKNYAGRLDAVGGLDRPFFETTAQKFKPGFSARMRDALNK